MPYVPGVTVQGNSGLPEVRDVYNSPNVFANNVEIALWKEAVDTAAFVLSLTTPENTYVFEQVDVDHVTPETAAYVANSTESAVYVGTSTGVMSGLTTSPTTSLPIDESGNTVNTSTAAVLTATYQVTNWDQFNDNNIPYDTLMLTPKTSLATFTTKAALWKNQPTPLGPKAQYSSGSAGDNKHIIAQDYYVGGKVAGRLTVPQILHNLSNLAKNIYEPLKEKYPNIIVTNTFRQNPPGGQRTQAQHGLGMAMDVVFPGASATDYYNISCWIRDNLPIDQLLQEKAGSTRWIHISHYSGFGYQVPKVNKVANCIVSPSYSFVPGLSIMA
jgi:hypothetical protein